MSISLRLEVRSVGGGEPRYFDVDREEIRIGRGHDVDVRLPHPAVSIVHVVLRRAGDDLEACDAGSANGTAHNGAPLGAEARVALALGDALTVAGQFVVVYRGPSPVDAGPTSVEQTGALVRLFAREILSRRGTELGVESAVELVGHSGPAAGSRRQLDAAMGSLVVGRGDSCGWGIAQDPDLSREHFEVRRSWDRVLVRDLQSKNGTAVDGEQLGSEAVDVGDGTVISAGQSVFRIVDPAARFLEALGEEDPRSLSAITATEAAVIAEGARESIHAAPTELLGVAAGRARPPDRARRWVALAIPALAAAVALAGLVYLFL